MDNKNDMNILEKGIVQEFFLNLYEKYEFVIEIRLEKKHPYHKDVFIICSR